MPLRELLYNKRLNLYVAEMFDKLLPEDFPYVQNKLMVEMSNFVVKN